VPGPGSSIDLSWPIHTLLSIKEVVRLSLPGQDKAGTLKGFPATHYEPTGKDNPRIY